jgi:predicted transcriptional regulator
LSSKKKTNATIALDKSQFDQLISSVHDLVRVLAAGQVKSADTTRNARFLRAFGLNESEIGDILGKTQQAIALALKKRKSKTGSKR